MTDAYNKTLASTLYTKLGGNVNHDFKSVFCELTDNSLDEGATEIKAWCEPPDEEGFYSLYFQDNGNGVKNIYNLLNGSSGKKDKIGKKNSGFTDSLVWITQLSGSLEVFSAYNFDYKYNKIPFIEATREFERQNNKRDLSEVNYDKIWEIMKPNIQNVIDKELVLFKLSKLNINNFEQGTVFRFRFTKANDLTELLQTNKIEKDETDAYFKDNFANYIQTVIQDYEFKLILSNADEDIYEIGKMNDFNRTDKYTPAIFSLNIGRRNTEMIGLVVNNVDDNEICLKKTTNNDISKVNIIDKASFDSQNEAYDMSDSVGVTAYLTCLNDEDAKDQQSNFQLKAFEDLRGVTFMTKGRILGASIPFTDLKIAGSQLRNYHNIRLLLDISDKTIIKQLTMVNKSSLNVSELCPLIKRFIKYIFENYIKKQFHVNSVSEDKKVEIKNSGIIDTIQFLNGGGGVIPPPPIPSNLREFKTSIYFGIYNAMKDGIDLGGENEDSIICKFGFTDDNPKDRDASQNKADLSKFLRIFSIFINETGGKLIEGTNKIRCENDIYIALTESKLVTSWYKNSKEIFTCKLINFKRIKELVSNTCLKYEREYI